MMALHDIAVHPFPFVHPESLDLSDKVHIFSAVIGKNHKIINSNDFISYNDNSEVSNAGLVYW